MPGVDNDSENNVLVVKIRTKLNKIVQFQKGKLGLYLEKLYAQQQTVQDTLEGKFSAMECEVQWNNIKKCYWITEVDTKARKPWITQEMVIKMEE
jgi:hypothetical protein